MVPDKEIIRFIKEHHVMTLATSVNDRPYCANVFYAWMGSDNCFVFTSSDETRHASEAINNKHVAASVVLETSVVGKIRGVQITGIMERPEGEAFDKAKSRYLKKFPFAAVMRLDLWVLKPEFMKLTDNRLGFGKKIIWNKEED
ncbi:MAG: pyridoxamine 5'-phosphate oxidase family protein [Rikenellaceae bacterium]|nr:pyridoxamine 5'-phosphate oxidase family protein [Rikenellaceae bacterium]